MYQATTPTITLTFPNTSPDLRTLGTCVVTLVQGSVEYEITPTVAEHSLSFTLTQAQTVKLKPTGISVQANFLKSNGTRVCSNVLTSHVMENLKNEVMP